MLEPDQATDPMAAGKTSDYAGAMLVDPLDQMTRYTDIQCAMTTTGENIDTWLVRHDCTESAKWMPDQIRHDGNLG